MLASTVQFSTYDQSPTRLHRQTRTSPQEQRRYDRRSALSEKKRLPALSGPNSVPTNRTPTSRLRSTHPPKGMQYWEPATRAGRTGQCSTLEHHPRCVQPVEMTGRHDLGAALDRQHVCCRPGAP